VCWSIWLARNKIIFQDSFILWNKISTNIEALFHLIPKEKPKNQTQIIAPEVIDKSFPWTYFDDSAQEIGCGGGAILYLTNNHYYRLNMGFGSSTNNYAELNNLKLLLIFALEKNCNWT